MNRFSKLTPKPYKLFYSQRKNYAKIWGLFFAIYLITILSTLLKIKHGFENENKKINPVVIFKDGLNSVVACKFPNMCIKDRKMTTIFLPILFKKHTAFLNDCVVARYTQIKFYEENMLAFPSHPVFYNINLVGSSLTDRNFRHFPHLARHFVKHIMYPWTLFFGTKKKFWKYAECYYPFQGKMKICNTKTTQFTKLHLLVSNSTLRKEHSWNYEFLTMFTTRNKSRRSENIFVGKENSFECYKSGYISPRFFDAAKKESISYFKSMGLNLRPRCPSRIAIVFRNSSSRGNRITPLKYVKALESKLKKHTNISVETITDLGLLSFSDQVSLMQRVDVLVCTHGAELGNSIFLREGTTVIEIYPFRFESAFFQEVFKSFRIKHVKFFAEPDKRHLWQCFKSEFNNSELEHVSAYENATSGEERQKIARFNGGICYKNQEIRFEVDYLVSTIVSQTKNSCK